ncbi:unnamed protein product [Orchesella dallaii]|uniref:Uncharacterized protein n=1 Tax=Orchesella dallaii TaxID=48710 RepID=A0ABP1Q994_9HEXA
MGNESSDPPPTSKRREKERQGAASNRQGTNVSTFASTNTNRTRIGAAGRSQKTTTKPQTTNVDKVDIPRLSDELNKLLHRSKRNETFVVKKSLDPITQRTGSAPGTGNGTTSGKAPPSANLDEAQTLQIKNVLAECLQNLHQARKKPSFEDKNGKLSLTDTCKPSEAMKKSSGPVFKLSGSEPVAKASLLRSYLSGSNPSREEYVSRRKNVSNSLISSDSIHHSIFLESGRERRQCLLQYLSKVVSDGQVVIYANSIPGVESLMSFLSKHGFQVNMMHPKMLMAESNWILSEFSLKKFAVLLCAEDHYHSCPAHFRWVKTIINYELPISSPLENWTIRNGIVEFSDNLPVHIYTFIKKTCPLDNELVKLLHLDSEDHEEVLPVLNERVHSAQ